MKNGAAGTAAVPKLGVGLAYQDALGPFILDAPPALDFVEIVPDIVWTDLGPGAEPRYVEDPAAIAFLERVRRQRPVIPHGIGLSIGTAHSFNLDQLDQLARWHDRLEFPWHSEHLSYNVAEHIDGGELNVGVTMPLPYDWETLELLAGRVAEVRRRVPALLLLENNVYYFDLPEAELEEPDFLNQLSELSGCHLLLDLHNLYVNSRNHGLDPTEFLERLELERVVELHLGGGLEYDGWYLDSHSGATPEPVWELLEWALPRCPNVGGMVFELLGSWYEPLGPERLTAELERMKAAGSGISRPRSRWRDPDCIPGGARAAAGRRRFPRRGAGAGRAGSRRGPDGTRAAARRRGGVGRRARDHADAARRLAAQQGAPDEMTCALLGHERLARELRDFWRTRTPRSLYFREEAIAFCDHLRERARSTLRLVYLEEVVGFERATLELRAPWAPNPPRPQEV